MCCSFGNRGISMLEKRWIRNIATVDFLYNSTRVIAFPSGQYGNCGGRQGLRSCLKSFEASRAWYGDFSGSLGDISRLPASLSCHRFWFFKNYPPWRRTESNPWLRRYSRVSTSFSNTPCPHLWNMCRYFQLFPAEPKSWKTSIKTKRWRKKVKSRRIQTTEITNILKFTGFQRYSS